MGGSVLLGSECMGEGLWVGLYCEGVSVGRYMYVEMYIYL